MDRRPVDILAELVLEDDDTGPLVRIILSRMLSTSSIHREDARNAFDRCQEVDPDRLFMNLARVLQDCHQDTGIRTLAAHLLKQHLPELQNTQIPVDDDDVYLMWDRITRENRNSIKSILLSCVQHQTTKRCLMLKLCATISSLASRVIPDWPELYSFIRTGLSSASPSEAALLIFAESPKFMLDSLGVRRIKEVFSQILANDSLTTDLKIAALSAAIKFISCLSKPADISIFQDLVTPIMKMTTAVMGEDETYGEEVLGLLNGMDPNFLMKEQRKSWVVLGSALDIAENDTLEEGTRHSAIHLMTNLVESAPHQIPCMATFIENFISLGLKMMLYIKDKPGLYTLTSSDKSSNYFVGKQCFTRFATAVHEYSIFPIAFVLLKKYLTAPNWKSRHAALVALAEISHGCSKVMNENIELVGTMAIDSVQDPHPHVRWAAANLIFNLAVHCSSFKVCYREQVQTVLAPVMNDQTYPRVQERAADAYRRFIPKGN